jgi:phosphoribosyl 1,2-cyclic phosphate phosphodiesterase
MEILFLGTGTSTGVPQIGCKCPTCISTNRKDKRLRVSILVTNGSSKILIDCGPDFRQQMLNYQIDSLSGILITHEHYDHLGGLDDVRPLGHTHVYGEKRVLSVIKQNLAYSFQENKYPGVPKISINEIATTPFYINKTLIIPIRVMHAKLPILGFRIGKMAYITDIKTISEEAVEQLADLDVLILSALRIETHISHLSLKEALELTRKIAAKKTYFTHMSHDMGLHEGMNKILSKNVELAYDGMIIVIN